MRFCRSPAHYHEKRAAEGKLKSPRPTSRHLKSSIQPLKKARFWLRTWQAEKLPTTHPTNPGCGKVKLSHEWKRGQIRKAPQKASTARRIPSSVVVLLQNKLTAAHHFCRSTFCLKRRKQCWRPEINIPHQPQPSHSMGSYTLGLQRDTHTLSHTLKQLLLLL
jgi:hypothetical protein